MDGHRIFRFGAFEADCRTGELRRAGVRMRLQAQPFQILTLLLDRPGEIVTRAEIVQKLWGGDTFVDFDQSIGSAIRKLRRVLGDSAAAPRYIETLRNQGYRFLAPVQIQISSPPSRGAVEAPKSGMSPGLRGHVSTGLTAGLAIGMALAALLVWSGSVESHWRVSQHAPARPQNMDAWLAYQKGMYLLRTRTATAVENSIGYFQHALNLEPNYASAHAGLANAWAVLNFYTGRQRQVLMERAWAANQRALQLDHSMAEAHATRAYIRFYHKWDWPGAESAFKTAITLNPGCATAHQWYAEYLFYMARFDEAVREINRAHELDPQSVLISAQVASPLMFSRQYDEAIEKIKEALKLDPEFALGIYMLATCYEQQGRFDEALSEYRKISGSAMGLTGLGYACARSGRQPEALQILKKLLDDSGRDGVSGYHVARVYAGLGDTTQAFGWLKKAKDARDERMVMLKVDPKLDPLRSDSRFGELLQSIGLD